MGVIALPNHTLILAEQPSFLEIDFSNPIAMGLQQIYVPGVAQSAFTLNGAIGKQAIDGIVLETNSGESLSNSTASNYISVSASLSSAFTIAVVGARFSTPPASRTAVIASTRNGTESSGVSLELGNGYANANLIYFYPFGTSTGGAVYCNGVKATGTNPTNITVTNNKIHNVVASMTTHTIGNGHTLLAKASGASDYTNDVGIGMYAIWNRKLSDDEALSISVNPWQLLARPKSVILVAAGAAGGADLSGAAVAVPAAFGNVTQSLTLSAASIALATATGVVNQAVGLTGSAASVAIANGVATISATLAGDAVGQVLAGGAVNLTTTLSGTSVAAALAVGNLDAGTPGGLSGAAVAQSSAVGAVVSSIAISGVAPAVVTAAGGLTSTIALSSAAVSVAAASGDVTVGFGGLSGSALSQAAAGGSIALSVSMSAAALAQAVAQANLSGGTLAALPGGVYSLRDASPRYFTRDASPRYFTRDASPRYFAKTPQPRLAA